MSEQGSNTRKRGMTPYIFTLAPLAVERSWDVDYDYFHVLEAPVNDLMVRFDDGAPINLKQGVGLRVYGERFTLASATGQTVTVLAGFGHVFDARANINATITAEIAASISNVPVGTVACGAGAQTLLAALDAHRLALALQVDSAAAGGIFLGDITTANELGFYLEPGDKAFWPCRADIYAWNPNVSAVKVRLTNLRDI